MLSKITGFARLLAILLAIVAGIITLPGFDVVTALIVLGLIAGLTTSRDQLTNILIAAIALPLIGSALGNLPAVGAQLDGIFSNLGMAVAGHAAMGFVLAIYNIAVSDAKGLGGSGG